MMILYANKKNSIPIVRKMKNFMSISIGHHQNIVVAKRGALTSMMVQLTAMTRVTFIILAESVKSFLTIEFASQKFPPIT